MMALLINVLTMIITLAVTLKAILQSILMLREAPINEALIELAKLLASLDWF
jgi:hypothetical protein